MKPHVLPVRIYYEDTDHSGVVYHANYLKYMERAREHVLGADALVRLWEDEGVGFVVYQCSMKFREGARFGDVLEIRTMVTAGSDYRAIFQQDVWKPDGAAAMVQGEVHLCCVDRDNKLIKLPPSVLEMLRAQ